LKPKAQEQGTEEKFEKKGYWSSNGIKLINGKKKKIPETGRKKKEVGFLRIWKKSTGIQWPQNRKGKKDSTGGV